MGAYSDQKGFRSFPVRTQMVLGVGPSMSGPKRVEG